MKEEFENGFIEYHFPNIIEGLRMVGPIKKSFVGSEISEELVLAEVMDRMKPLIDKIEHNGKSISFEQVLSVKEAYGALIAIADKLSGELFLSEEKKSL